MGFLDDLFGGEINKRYREARQTLREHEATGREDIQQALQQALGYGEPYRGAGAAGLQEYMATLGMGGPGVVDRFRQSPGYQFALQQGLQAAQRGTAAQGLTGSGAEARELQRVGQGLASQEYGQYQNRLANLAGMGQTAAQQAAQQAYGTGQQLSGLGQYYAGQLSPLLQQWGQQAQQQQSGLMGGIGSLIGAGASILGNVLPGIGGLFGGGGGGMGGGSGGFLAPNYTTRFV